jgi:uncharacterized membrane protein YfhO
MFDNPSEDWRGNINLQSINNLKYKVDVGFNNSKNTYKVNNNIQTNTNNNYDYEFGVETLLIKFQE